MCTGGRRYMTFVQPKVHPGYRASSAEWHACGQGDMGDVESAGNATPVLLLKTKTTPVDGYEEYFAEKTRGKYTPIFVPVLEHHLIESALEKLASLIKQGAFQFPDQHDSSPPERYGGLIFTSQRAVEAFTTLIESLRHDNQPLQTLLPPTTPLYVVGPATARTLNTTHLPNPILGQGTGNGEALAAFILHHYNTHHQHPQPRPKPGLLFLVGEQRRDIIPTTLQSPSLPTTQQIPVTELPIYETRVMPGFPAAFSLLAHPAHDRRWPQWVVVFSPTGCGAMLDALGLLDPATGRVHGGGGARRDEARRTWIAAIGPTTREFLAREFGVEVDVCAGRPSPEGLGEAIEAFEKAFKEG